MNSETPPPSSGPSPASAPAAAPDEVSGDSADNASGDSADEVSGDSAWVSIDTPLDLETLAAHCRDVEGIFRVNPYLDFAEWKETAPGRYYFKAHNLSNDQDIDTAVREEISADGIRFFYESGIKTSTHFKIEATDGGSRLTITDDYSGTPPEERKARIEEVDKSLLNWGKYLLRYFHQWHKWGWCAPWRWYMHSLWRKMNPMGRRIAYILWIVTLFEIAGILLFTAVFALELDKYIF